MNKAYLSILLLFVSLVINSVVSSSYIPLHEGYKSKKKRAAARRKAAAAAAAALTRPAVVQTGLNKTAAVDVETVKNIIKDVIPPETKVQLIKSYIAQQ